ncbi:MAG: nodulation protein NfeD [Candidatus Theseobacter exili]|nr:nodulation protein NfeD [Candidatus Theseobacter exili]
MKKLFFSLLFLSGLFAINIQSEEQTSVSVLKINDLVINPIVARYISEQIQKSAENNNVCMIIEMDTPGGLLNSTRTIVKDILNSPIPIVVYVAPKGSRAGSAGVFITMASHVAAMAPGTNIGAAHPVTMGGKRKGFWDRLFDLVEKSKQQNKKSGQEQSKSDNNQKESTENEDSKDSDNPMSDKILNDSVAWIRALAKMHGRNEEWAAEAVTQSVSITAEEALKKGVINLIAEDLESLLQKMDGMEVKVLGKQQILHTKNSSVSFCEMGIQKKILNVISNPNIAYILMILGFYGLLYEVTHPGIGVPGIAGFICLILAFLAFQALPINYAGLILIGLAVALFVAETSVPSYGLLTLGGLISMVLGSLMLFDTSDAFTRVSVSVILPIALVTAIIVIFLCTLALKAYHKKSVTGKSGLIGTKGIAETDLNPSGQVFIHGEIWKATSSEPVDKGSNVIVTNVSGLELYVAKLEENIEKQVNKGE